MIKKLSKKGQAGWLPVVGIALLILLLGAMITFKKSIVEADKKNSIKESDTAINVVALKLSPQLMEDRINLPGVVKPWVQMVVSAEVAGHIIEKKSIEGKPVKKGEILAIINSSKYLNAYVAAKASFTSARATQKRLQNLFDSNLSNKSDLDSATAQVANYKAAMEIAALDLAKCEIKAPVAGIVNRLYFEKGQFTDIGKPIAEIIQIDKVKVNVGIPESDVNAVYNLTDFQVKFDGLKGKTFTAKKHYLSRTTSSLARLYDLEITIDNPTNEILPGMFGRIEIIKQKIDNAISIPLYSIISIKKTNIVYIAENNIAYKRLVKTGIQEGWMLEITDGLRSGEELIVVGQRNVADGQKINIVKSISDLEELSR